MAGNRTAQGEGTATGAPVCPVALCPVGMLLTVSNQMRPEVVEHLLKAGRELMLAVSMVMNARADAAGGSGRLQKIEVE
jgi:hypothetical protein